MNKIIASVFVISLFGSSVYASGCSEMAAFNTKNLNSNPNASLYFAQEEKHKIKSNNPRLTLQGLFKKLELKKDDPKFQMLLQNY